jgi:hypothetical protein
MNKENVTADSEVSQMGSKDDIEATKEELILERELLREENQRLRDSYIHAQQIHNRRTAFGFVILGLLATLGALFFPPVRTVLFALGATGFFGGLLTYYLTPERIVSAQVGAEIYKTFSANQRQIVDELGLEQTHLYVPVGDAKQGVRLFVPQNPEFEIPEGDSLTSAFVVSDEMKEQGLALEPIGERLYKEFERALSEPIGTTVDEIMPQLIDGLVKQFEVIDSLEFEFNSEQNQLIVEVEDNTFGQLNRMDHPIISFLASGLAHGLGTTVNVEVSDKDKTVIFLLRETMNANLEHG